ncbi:MAG: hypothetical protein U0X76_00215 [Bacteroidia bacterium]
MNRTKKNVLIKAALIIFLSLPLIADAQTVVLRKDPGNEILVDRGPNSKTHTSFYVGIGFPVSPDNKGAGIMYGLSLNTPIGFRIKYKIGSVYSMGWTIGYEYAEYKLKQNDTKVFPDTNRYDAQRLDINYGTLGYFNRFNFDPNRGNIIGAYLEIGVKAKYAFSASDIRKYKVPTGNAKTEISGLIYFNNFQADAYAELGRNHFYLNAALRLTKLFKSSYNFPDLPTLTVGIGVGF